MNIYKIANKKPKYLVTDSEFNKKNYPDLIGKVLENPPAYATVRLLQEEKKSLENIFKTMAPQFQENGVDHGAEDFVIKALKAGYNKEEIINSLKTFYNQSDETARRIFTKAIVIKNRLKSPLDKE